MREVGLSKSWNRQALRAPASTALAPSSRPHYAHALELPRDAVRSTSHSKTVNSRRGKMLPILAAVASGAVSFFLLTGGGREVRAGISMGPLVTKGLIAAGFGIDQVSVAGLVFTPDSDVFDAIDLAHVTTFANLDAAAVRVRIERLPWVETADLSRVYPGTLAIQIKERTPYALWRKGDRDYLIDRTGRMLSPVKREAKLAFPLVEGDGAEKEAPGLIEQIKRFPEVSQRLHRSEWVAGRRWTLHLKDNVTVHLPADRESLVLEEIVARPDLLALIRSSNRVVDLRAPGRATVRPLLAVNTAAGS